MADISSISKVCKHGVTLLVDNAHGAYLNHEDNLHPIALGADMCSDSAHKTLPILTVEGIFTSKSADKSFAENAKTAMSLFASTSPSYLMLSSLDLCNKYLYENIRADLKNIIPYIDNLKKELSKSNFIVCESET